MDLKDILLWHDVKVSAIVFFSGFVLLVCLTQFSVVSVLTNVALVCLAPMLALRLLLTARSAFLRSEFEHPLKYDYIIFKRKLHFLLSWPFVSWVTRFCLVPVRPSPRPSRSIIFDDVQEMTQPFSPDHVTQKRLARAKCRGLGTR